MDTCRRFQLEKLNEPKYWTSDYISYHVIFILDQLVDCLRKHKCRSYFFNNYDAIANSFRNVLAGHVADDYKEDADVIETFLQRYSVFYFVFIVPMYNYYLLIFWKIYTRLEFTRCHRPS